MVTCPRDVLLVIGTFSYQNRSQSISDACCLGCGMSRWFGGLGGVFVRTWFGKAAYPMSLRPLSYI